MPLPRVLDLFIEGIGRVWDLFIKVHPKEFGNPGQIKHCAKQCTENASQIICKSWKIENCAKECTKNPAEDASQII